MSKIKRPVEFRAVDALAFADAYRFGIRMSHGDLVAKIQAEAASGSMGPAALKGLEFAERNLVTGSIPAVVRYEIEVDEGSSVRLP